MARPALPAWLYAGLLIAGAVWLRSDTLSAQAPGGDLPPPAYGQTPLGINSTVPGAPTRPGPASPGAGWPNAPASDGGLSMKPFVAPQGAGVAQAVPGTTKVAQIGPEVILDSDLMGRYGVYQKAMAAGLPDEQLRGMREELATQLKNMIDVKLLYLDALKTIPPDGQKEIKEKIDEQFGKSMVEDLKKRAHLKTNAELDAELHKVGTSLEQRREAFYEQMLARYWLQQQVKPEEITFTMMWDYYSQQRAKFEYPARARWEELMVRWDKNQAAAADPQALAQIGGGFATRADADRAIREMGDAVLHGAPFAEVAKARSQGLTADKGGEHDWTTKGALVSKVMDSAIFSPSLPVGHMSTILEDDEGFHIIRVIERRDAGCVPFIDAQVDIKKQLKADREKKQTDEYLEKLRRLTPAWTILDDPAATADIAQAAAGAQAPRR